jgi:hypothetical protein
VPIAAHTKQMHDLETRLANRMTAPDAPNRLKALQDDPTLLMTQMGWTVDSWQRKVLTSTSPRLLLLCSRGAGKSQVSAALALRTALLTPASLILILSPTERQSGEFALKVFDMYDAADRPVPPVKRTELQLWLSNGSRVIALPGNERTVRTYNGARMLLIDEASRVPDDLYRSVRPMLGVSRGRLVALSTPFGKRGWFWKEWFGEEAWERVKVTAEECPRLSAEFLAEEWRVQGERWFSQEYLVQFGDMIQSYFSEADVEAAFADDLTPLFPGDGA